MSDVRCPACGTTNAAAQRFCGACGTALPAVPRGPQDVTVTSPSPIRTPTPTPPRIASDGQRFLPGQVLADRYRMVGLLGRGGMGEVYRADDLKLGQPVALKFLPRDVEDDPDRLERFLTEVRLSLRVTHPNVCRVFDIGEIETPAGSGHRRHFLSMEYVDGEDLASLLRRIGRLPEDKAVEIARQLCAGLGAAHDEGVLHRDLKPANVMIDGRGRAKITDFGLAGATAGISGREARAGTPQYMAPEQFDGRELTPQTDLYSLGLVLYELFTGKRAFDGRDALELMTMHSSAPTSPSAHVPGLSPIVERAILRCADPDPAQRPRSAASLAAALPGGDPLAMAIAAGETPSPEMVARSGGRGELKPAVAAAYLLVVIVGLVGTWFFEQHFSLQNRVPLPKPPEELRVAARAVIANAGYVDPPVSVAYDFSKDGDYLRFVDREVHTSDRFDNLANVSPSPVYFWYREAASPMAPMSGLGEVEQFNPPVTQAGMVSVRIDPKGRLLDFVVVPRDMTAARIAEPDWAPLFSAAGLVQAEWTPADPQWTPPVGCDARRAWTQDKTRIEAASLGGRAVWFRLIPPWRQPVEVRLATPNVADDIVQWVQPIVTLLIVVGAVFLARRNLLQGRSDRRGAFRLAIGYIALAMAFHVLLLPDRPSQWFDVIVTNFAMALCNGAVAWLFYVAIEPYIRRFWPGTLVAWSRALEGKFRDPMVGRHILIGAVGGMGFSLIFELPELLSHSTGLPMPVPAAALWVLHSAGTRVASILNVLQQSFLIPVSALMAVLVCRVLFRRVWVAYVFVYLVGFAFTSFGTRGWVPTLDVLLTFTLLLFLLTRFGLLAFLVGIVFSGWAELAITGDPSSWFFPGSVFTMTFFVAVAIYGFWVSLGGQKLIKDAL